MVFRGFVALETSAFPPIVALLDELEALPADLKVVRPENLHVTVKFLGNVADEDAAGIASAMTEAAAPCAPVPYELVGVGTFPPRGAPRVIWAGITGAEPIRPVAGDLDDRLATLGFAKERRAFKAHVTLARVRSPEGAGRVRAFIAAHHDDLFGGGTFTELRLMKSELAPTGPTYSVLARAPFLASAGA